MTSDIKSPKRGIKTGKPKKSDLETAIEEYKDFLADQTHPENQTEAYQNNLRHTLNKLFVAADEREEINPGEGFYSLLVLTLRSVLSVKDELVKLRVEVRDLRIELKKLKKQ